MTPYTLNEKHSRLDKLQLLALCGLMVIGALFVYSATYANPAETQKAWYAQIWFRQIIWYGVGLAAAAGLCTVSYHTLARWSFVFYWAMIICLITVLIPFTVKVWQV